MSPAGLLTAHRPERVAVVIPAKNEAERIEATIGAAREIRGVDLVVVVDDGSSDATSAVAMGADALVVRHKSNRGKAAAMATGAQMVAIREDAERADGGDHFSEELHAEPRSPGHTGPLPVIGGTAPPPRALLFLDADMETSAIASQPLVDAVLGQGVDMAIALLPPQDGAAGMGIVVRTARKGIQRATGWEAAQPLSGTRCITRETWDACQPLAPGWGVETSLTIDALTGGFWVKEIEADLRHRATGKDLRGQLHRAAQLRDVMRALARRRHVLPDEPADELDEGTEVQTPPTQAPVDAPDAPDAPGDVDAESADTPTTGATPLAFEDENVDEVNAWDQIDAIPATGSAASFETDVDLEPTLDRETEKRTETEEDPAAATDEDAVPNLDAAADADADADAVPDTGIAAEAVDRTAAADDRAALAERRRDRLEALPVRGGFSDSETRALGDLDVETLNRQLRALPVAGDFAPDDVVYLAGVDLEALAARLNSAPVQERFEPEHAVIIASHLSVPEPELPPSIRPPLTSDEYTSLVVHAAVDAGNASDA